MHEVSRNGGAKKEGGKLSPLAGSNPLQLLGSELPFYGSWGVPLLRLLRIQHPWDLKAFGEESARGVQERFMHSKASIHGSLPYGFPGATTKKPRN